ncbi:TRAP transporter large permease [Alkalihalobacillus sp. BA299]|uniref:TRAP transporter large permease n=1 Tax=Alkalihalobacillus sp. BA299 TaxID=2815938 RepID=UPI001ADC61F8|nr:TRAP transporter large permease [Alkalihalobacillus sp. BA299]
MLALVGIAFLILLIAGLPIAFAMGSASVIGIVFKSDIPLTLIAQRMFEGLNSFTLLAIPFFILAGQLMEKGGISKRLVDFSYSVVGYIKGGLGMSSIMTSTIFAGISGSAAADTAAVGSVLIPAMKKKRYPIGLAATLQACAGSLGTIIPPSMVMIIYGSITGISIGALFMAGVIPGLLMALGMMIVTYFYGAKYNLKEEGRPQLKQVWKTTKDAIWALILPIVVIGGIITGFFTATEAGIIAVLYALFIGLFVYKEYRIKDIPKILQEAAANTSMALLIIAGAAILGWIVAYVQLPQTVIKFLASVTENPLIIMLLIVIFIMIIGMFIETIAATILVAPVLIPIYQQFGLDPVHFGFVMVAAFVFAGVTPPVGGILYITASIGRAKLKEMLPYLFPYVGVMLLVVILTIFIPQLATYVPSLFFDI